LASCFFLDLPSHYTIFRPTIYIFIGVSFVFIQTVSFFSCFPRVIFLFTFSGAHKFNILCLSLFFSLLLFPSTCLCAARMRWKTKLRLVLLVLLFLSLFLLIEIDSAIYLFMPPHRITITSLCACACPPLSKRPGPLPQPKKWGTRLDKKNDFSVVCA